MIGRTSPLARAQAFVSSGQAAQQQRLLFVPTFLEDAQSAYDAGQRLLLVSGESGTGKTALGLGLGAAAQHAGGALIRVQLGSPEAREALLREEPGLWASGDTMEVYLAQAARRAARVSRAAPGRLVVLLIDDWDLASPRLDALIARCAGPRAGDASPGAEAGHALERLPADTLVWITTRGQRAVAAELEQRAVHLECPPLEDAALYEVLRRDGPCGNYLATTLGRYAAKARALRHPLPLPALLHTAARLRGARSLQACRLAMNELLGANWRVTDDPGGEAWSSICRDMRQHHL